MSLKSPHPIVFGIPCYMLASTTAKTTTPGKPCMDHFSQDCQPWSMNPDETLKTNPFA